MGKNIFSSITLGKYQEESMDIPMSAFEAFKRLYGSFATLFLLESLGEEGKFNRYSYVGFDPIFLITAKGKSLTINDKTHHAENPYSELFTLGKFHENESDFSGGLVGYISHEGTQYFEKAFIPKSGGEFSDFSFGFYLDGLKFDKKTKKCIYFHHGKSRLNTILPLLNGSGKLGVFSCQKKDILLKEKYKTLFKRAKEEIEKGNIFQVVLSLRSNYHLLGDKRRLYASLRMINPSPYMSYLKFGDQEILSASPELLIRIKDRNLEHFGTLAGTIKRGKTHDEDTLFATKLQTNEKEKAEHMMLVDLARNDVGKVSEFGSVRVEKLASVKKFSHVQHLYSEIRGTLMKAENLFSALSACFPAGTLTGAPKVEAMKLINELEKYARGPYGGVIGFASLSGEAMFAISIRSIFIHGASAYTQTGSGIVLDSTLDGEFQEIAIKQKAMEEALRIASHSQSKPFSFRKT